MPKLRKQRRKKVFRHNINRKRLRNKIESVGKISCKEIKDAWDKSKSVQSNLNEMGLSYDPNKTLPVLEPKSSKKTPKQLNKNVNDETLSEFNKNHVAEALEADAKAPREKLFRLPKGQVAWITYLLDKYKSDYRAMTKDAKNHQQETWKQLRAKIRRFKSIPAQYNVFLKARNLQPGDIDDDSGSSDGEI